MYLQHVSIPCGAGENAYDVILEVETLDGLKAAAADPALRARTGEDLVSAVLTAIGGDIAILKRLKDGTLQEGPGSLPSYVSYFTGTGLPAEVSYHTNGALNDAVDGTPAHIRYNNRNGRLREIAYADRYRNGAHVKTLSRHEKKNIAAEIAAYRETHAADIARNAARGETKKTIAAAIPGLKIL